MGVSPVLDFLVLVRVARCSLSTVLPFCQAGIVVLSQAASPLRLQFPFFARLLSGFWSGLEAAHLRQFRRFRDRVASRHAVVLLRLHFPLLRYQAPALSRIFRAIERRHVRRVSIEIRARDLKLFLMRIDPLPQLLGRCVPLRRFSPLTLTRSAASP